MFTKPLQYNKPRSFKLNLHLGNQNLDTSLVNSSFTNLIDSKDKQSILRRKCSSRKSSPFPTNFIRTTKYSLITFLPKSLASQFYRYANIYFLVIAVLQCFPDISPLHPFSAITPLVFVLSLSLLREGYEDYIRYKSDVETNNYQCEILENGVPVTKTWKDIVIGDVLLVKNDQFLPADLILLGSSDDSGICFIETSSLDGEKNLKAKVALKQTINCVSKTASLREMRDWELKAGKPTANIYHFEGHFSITEDGEVKERIMLNEKQFLLRGSKLKNTKWVLGVVVYSGLDTRIMRNTGTGKMKQSNIEKRTNKYILGILIFQLVCSSCGSLMYFIYGKRNEYIYGFYHNPKFTIESESVLIFLTYFLLNNTMIPISLIVSLEFVKFAQSYFINKDDDMYVASNDKFAKVMTSSINEELGQVEYIFTDKTGTLTCNKMEFKLLVIGNNIYGGDYVFNSGSPLLKKKKNDSNSITKISKQNSTARRKSIQERTKSKKTTQIIDERSNIIFDFYDKNLKSALKKIALRGSTLSSKNFADEVGDSVSTNTKPSEEEAKLMKKPILVFNDKMTGQPLYEISTELDLIFEIFLIMSTCHECVIDIDEKTNYTHYLGQSSDEIALVDAARHLGFKFQGSNKTSLSLNIFREERRMEILYVFPFDSNRKRMSIIVRDQGVIKLYMKGADNSVKSLLDNDIIQPFKIFTDMCVDRMCKKGFRSLCIGMKVLSEDQWRGYKSKIDSLIGKVLDFESEILKLAEEIEKGLTLIGATGVEDKLQENVPSTISDLLSANIKIWMLTGDKLETAENIGISCSLIEPGMSIIRISSERISKDLTVESILDEAVDIFKLCVGQSKKKALLVDGICLGIIFSNQTLCQKFLQMSKSCEAVICCRVTPGQKADVVKQIKHNYGKISVAIGDGANDVSMIQEANIGIGVFGQEGTRAVQASDYAVGEFQCIWKLLLVHGRWSYIRVSQMILYFFYKNMVLTFPQVLFSFYSDYSGQTVFDDWYISFYNMIFTAVPLVIRAVLDQDVYYKFWNPQNSKKVHPQNNSSIDTVKERVLIKLNYPKIYYVGQRNTIFRFIDFLYWIFQGILHSTYIFYINYYAFYNSVLTDDGYVNDIWIFSISTFTCIILLVNLKLALKTHSWTLLMVISIVVMSLLVYFAYIWVSDMYSGFMVYKTAEILFFSSQFHFSCFLSVGILLLIDLTLTVVNKELTDSIVDYFQYLIKYGKENDGNYYKKVEEMYNAFLSADFHVVKKKRNNGVLQAKKGGHQMVPNMNSPKFSKPLVQASDISSYSESGAEDLQVRFSNTNLKIPLNSSTSPEKSSDDFVSEDVNIKVFKTNINENTRTLVIK